MASEFSGTGIFGDDEISAQALEKKRLECFCLKLAAMGLTTRLTWNNTQYHLTIQRGWWPLRRTIQILHRETMPHKPMTPCDWEPSTDAYLLSALTSLYQDSLKHVLELRGVGLPITDRMRMAIPRFSNALAFGLHAFPVLWTDDDADSDKFWVVSRAPFTDDNLRFAEFLHPGIYIQRMDPKEYPHIQEYLNFYLETFFGGVATPYTTLNLGCNCVLS